MTPPTPSDLDALRGIPLFACLSHEQLEQLVTRGRRLTVRRGEVFVREGEPAGPFYVVVAGAVEFKTRQVGGREVHVTNIAAGECFGHELTLVGAPSFLGSGCALEDGELFRLEEPDFWQLLATCRQLARALLQSTARRWQNYEGVLQEQAKFIALGTLAAGLAHELNNPAAAVLRASGHLEEHLRAQPLLALALARRPLAPEAQALLALALEEALALSAAPPRWTGLALGDREEELAQWLEAHGIPEGWKLATALAAAGLERPWLERLLGAVGPDVFAAAVAWLENALAAAGLLTQIRQGVGRISHLVQAVKDYSYLDQAPLLEVDIHEGLESTLEVLSSRLCGITIHREYEPSLPRLNASGSELNQVWTCLIDNAIDAMNGQGRLILRSFLQGDRAVVEVIDDGPGIPEAIRPRIFDPFFTTKPVGRGTGLGLDTARRIVVGRHKGEIRVDSRPGRTVFQVRLPLGELPL